MEEEKGGGGRENECIVVNRFNAISIKILFKTVWAILKYIWKWQRASKSQEILKITKYEKLLLFNIL